MCRCFLPFGELCLKSSPPGLLRDPDSVVLCVLAADDADDVALQIHFTLLQSFCCESGLTILRVSGLRRLQQLLGTPDDNRNQDEHRDLNCMLVTVSGLTYVTAGPCFYRTWDESRQCFNLFLCAIALQNPQADHCRLQEVGTYCQESRRLDQWVPELVLQER